MINARAAWKGSKIEIYGEVLNIFNSRDKDIAYQYQSFIPAYDSDGPADGRLSRVVEPRTFKIGAPYTF